MTAYPARYRPPAGYLRRYRPGRRGGTASRTEMIAGLAIGAVLLAGTGTGTAVTVTRHKAAPRVQAAPQHQTLAAPAVPVSASGNAALGHHLAGGYGWTGSQWTCLDNLWTRESGWQQYVMNPQSGAFGIPQSLTHGGSSPATPPVVTFPDGTREHGVQVNQYPTYAANDGDPAAQIKWGLAYIQSAYTTPCSAWQHETAAGWY